MYIKTDSLGHHQIMDGDLLPYQSYRPTNVLSLSQVDNVVFNLIRPKKFGKEYQIALLKNNLIVGRSTANGAAGSTSITDRTSYPQGYLMWNVIGRLQPGKTAQDLQVALQERGFKKL